MTKIKMLILVSLFLGLLLNPLMGQSATMLFEWMLDPSYTLLVSDSSCYVYGGRKLGIIQVKPLDYLHNEEFREKIASWYEGKGYSATDIELSGNHILVTDGSISTGSNSGNSRGFMVFNVANDEPSFSAGKVASGLDALEIQGDYAFVLGKDLYQFDISNPEQPKPDSKTQTKLKTKSNNDWYSIDIKDDVAFIAGKDRLFAVDISSDKTFSKLNDLQYKNSPDVEGLGPTPKVVVREDIAFVSTLDQIEIVDVTHPDQLLEHHATLSVSPQIYDLAVYKDKIYASLGTRLAVIDISELKKPEVIWKTTKYMYKSVITDITVKDGLLYFVSAVALRVAEFVEGEGLQFKGIYTF